MRYTDPNGMWKENADGSYTAQEGDTLSGLSQITGKDWHDTNYQGKPENLQIGQNVKFNNHTIDKLDATTGYASDILGVAGEVAKNSGKAWFTAGSSSQLPLPTLADPDLMRKAELCSDFGKVLLGLGLVIDVADGIKTGIDNNSVSRGIYRTTINIMATSFGYIVGGGITGLCTAGTFGTGAIPGILFGTAAGSATALGITAAGSWGENRIWGKSK